MTRTRSFGADVQVFANELRRLCKLTRLNFPGLFIQAWHETDGFTSEAWNKNKNPAGIKNKSGKAYQRFANGVDAARAFVVHMSAYVPVDKAVIEDYIDLDDRYDVAKKANAGKTFETFNDLSGKWAEDLGYGEWIERRFGEVLG